VGGAPEAPDIETDVSIHFALWNNEETGLNGSGTYNTDYPATVGPHMTNTDSTQFMNLTPSISLRENERGAHTNVGWNPS